MHRIADRARVELVCARTPERASHIARQFGLPRWTTDWREALDGSFDAVINLTPGPLHGEINLALAKARTPFYSEKPLSVSLAEAREILATCEAQGVMAVSAPSVLAFPQVVRAEVLLTAGVIGSIHVVRAHAVTPPPPWDGFAGDHAPYFRSDVGPLTDMGVYPLHAITGLLGPAVEVSAMTARTRDAFDVTEGAFAGTRVQVEVDDVWHLSLRLASGALAQVTASFAIPRLEAPEIEVAGEAGTLSMSLLDPAVPLRLFSAATGSWSEIPVEHSRLDGPDHILGIDHLLRCLEDGTAPRLSLAHAVHVLEIRDGAGRSAAEGRRVRLDAA
jgi:predicted dehydrogenase